MNKRLSSLAIGFFVMCVFQGFRTYDPNISLETVIKEEQGKYPKITEENINAVIKLGKEKAGFPDINPKEIIYFFHAAHFDVEKTIEMVVKHYKIREQLPTIFNIDGKDPEKSELEEVKKVVSCSILHNDSFETDGMHYIYTDFVNKRAFKFDFVKTVRYFFYMIKCLLIQYGTFEGVTFVINAKHFSFTHYLIIARHYKLFSALSKLLHEALPFRLKKTYVLYASRTVIKFHEFSRKHREKAVESTVVFYGEEPQEVYKHVPQTIMPNDGYLNGEGQSYIDQAAKTYALMEKLHHQDEPSSIQDNPNNVD